jgi:hypothetical protein
LKRIPRALALLLLLAAPAAAGPESDAERKARVEKTGFWTEASADYTWDSNVHTLSSQEIDLLHSTDLAVFSVQQQRFDRMNAVTDNVVKALGGLFAQGKLGRMGLELGYQTHVKNRIKDFVTIRPAYRAYLEEGSFLEAWTRADLGRFDRNFFGRERTTTRFPGLYDTYAGGLVLDWRWPKWGGLGTRLHADYAEDHYVEEQVSYRDAVIRGTGVDLGWRWNAWLYTELGYRFQQTLAKRSVSSDRSNEEQRWAIRAEVKPTNKLALWADYTGYRVGYTTVRKEAEAPNFAGRRDQGWELTLRGTYELHPALTVYAQAKREERRNNLPIPANEELLRYGRYLYSIGAQTRLGIPIRYGEPDDKLRTLEADKGGFWSSLAMSFAYDDNVHRLSPEDLSSRKSANLRVDGPVQKRWDLMTGVDDGVWRYLFGLYEQARPWGDGYGNRLGLELDYWKYMENSVKDYPVWRAFMRQYIEDRHFFETYYSVALNQFERNYFGRTETARRFPGTLNTRAAGVLWDGGVGFFGWLGLGAGFEYGEDRYLEPQLSYRNADYRRFWGKISRKWTEQFSTEARYKFEELRAWRSAVHDRSYDEHQWTLLGRGKPWRDLLLTGTYTGSFRGYNTNLRNSQDPTHAGRRDFLHEISVRADYPYKTWGFWVEYARAQSRANLSFFDSDEYLRYTKNVYSLGVQSRWDLSFLSYIFE